MTKETKAIKSLGFLDVQRLQELGYSGKKMYIPKKKWHKAGREYIKKYFKMRRKEGKQINEIFEELAELTHLSPNYIKWVIYRKESTSL